MSVHHTSMHSLPAVLLGLAALLALAACGTADEKKPPTAATIAALYGMQAVSDALYDAALGAADSPPSLPYATAPQAPADTSEPAAFAQSMIGSLVGLSQPLTTVDFPNDNHNCRGGGWVTLNGSAIVDDLRDGFGYGNVSLVISGLVVTASACRGHSYQVDGTKTVNVNDMVIRSDNGDGTDHWILNRNESASGSGTITKVATGASYGVSFSWSRSGMIAVDTDPSTGQMVPASATINQTVSLSVNGQTCTGTITSFNLFVGYSWTCSGP